MASKPPVTPGMKKNSVEDRMVSFIDRATKFEEFERDILPALQESVRRGEAPAAMRRKYLSHVQARQITEALTNPDATKALAAVNSILDREEGKPVERKDVQHRLGKLNEKELDALLISKIDDMPAEALDGGDEE